MTTFETFTLRGEQAVCLIYHGLSVSPSGAYMQSHTKIVGFPADSGTQGEADSLPCLNSNISIITPTETLIAGLCQLSTQHRKTAFILTQSVAMLADKYGLERLGFLTLTFRDHLLDPKEAQRRLNSLLTNVIKHRYLEYLGVFERQKSGRIHYHFLVVLHSDIRRGLDWSQVAQGNYRSASPALRSEWAFWRATAPSYGFGRTELLPVKSTTEAISKYVGKYIAKHVEARSEDDKGVRLVRYSRGARAGTTRFSFNSAGGKEWRQKVARLAAFLEEQSGAPCREISDLSRIMGKRWAYRYREQILRIKIVQTDRANTKGKGSGG